MQCNVLCIIVLYQGLGYAATMITFLMGIYYNVIMAWAFYYLFASFTAELPWARCGHSWNTPSCVETVLGKITSSNSSTNYTLANHTTQSYDVIDDAYYVNITGANVTGRMVTGGRNDPVTEYWQYEHNYKNMFSTYIYV